MDKMDKDNMDYMDKDNMNSQHSDDHISRIKIIRYKYIKDSQHNHYHEHGEEIQIIYHNQND